MHTSFSQPKSGDAHRIGQSNTQNYKERLAARNERRRDSRSRVLREGVADANYLPLFTLLGRSLLPRNTLQ